MTHEFAHPDRGRVGDLFSASPRLHSERDAAFNCVRHLGGCRGRYDLHCCGAKKPLTASVCTCFTPTQTDRLNPIRRAARRQRPPSKTAFGISMALIGDTLVVGAQFADARAHDAGLAYVFERHDQEWRQASVLSASDAAADDQFGLTVSVRGTTIVVGARLQDSGGGDAGAAYVFARDDAGWRQTAKLRASDAARGDLFGRASVETNTIVISADLNNDRGFNAGKAYAFERREGKWIEAASLTAEDGAERDEFGVSLALSGDTAVFGAASGAAYVFERREGRWAQSARLRARNETTRNGFGWAVAAAADTIVVGAPNDASKAESAGAAYVYERGGGGWTEAAKLTASDAAAASRFGMSVAIRGGTIVVGMRLDENSTRAGAAYVFERVRGRWSEVARLDDTPTP